eukprot:jgi/Tetstr1/438242/TSEL_002894.t1
MLMQNLSPDQATDATVMHPCNQANTLVDRYPFALGVATWPNATAESWSNTPRTQLVTVNTSAGGEWFGAGNQYTQACDPDSQGMLQAQGATIAIFSLEGGSFQVLRARPAHYMILNAMNYRAAVKNGTADYCCTSSMALFNNMDTGPPVTVVRLDPNEYQEYPDEPQPNGVAVFSHALVVSQYAGSQYANVAFIQPQPMYNETVSIVCQKCSGFNMTAFLAESGALAEVEAAGEDPARLAFRCFGRYTCAWGPAFCDACLDNGYAGRSMPGWFSYFVNYYYRNGTAFTEEQRPLADLLACDTFCSPFFYIWFYGTDYESQQFHQVAGSLGEFFELSPLAALKSFRIMFGLSAAFLDALGRGGLT